MKKNLSFSLFILLCTSTLSLAKDVEPKEIGSITIIGNESSNYLNEGETSINRSNVNIENSAKSIQVFNEDLIQDAKLQSIEDIIRMSSNTVYTGDTDGKSANISMRGFSGTPILIDGMMLTNKIGHPEVFNLEAVEIQKGPDSLQYGQSSPGGLVNLVSKKPTKEFTANVELEINDNPSYSPKLDIGGSLNEDNSLYFRLVSLFKYDEGWTNSNTNTNKIFIAPSLSYDINDNHTLTFVAEYTDEKTPTNFGTNVNSNGKLVAPIENVTSHPDEEFEKTQKIIGFDLDSNINSWDSNFRYRYIEHERDYGNVYLPLYFENPDIVGRYPAEQVQEFSEHALQYTLNNEFDLFGKKNNITFGADYNKAYSKAHSRVELSRLDINLSNPTYENKIRDLDESGFIRDMSRKKTYVQSWGTFLQDSISLTDNLIFNTGLRYSESKPENGQKSDALTPSLGLLYKFSPQTSIYTNYSESFTPQGASTVDSSGNILDPEKGKGYEIGIKQKLFDDNVSLTAALFKIKKVNVAKLDESTTYNTSDYKLSGEQESKGFEIDISGKITNNLSIIASYGYTKTKDKNNDDLQLRNIPKHTANIFSTYYLSSFDLPNIYVGGGLRFLGSRYADDANTIKLDSTIIYNATLGYKKGNWKASLNVQNLTDEEYVDGSASGSTTDTRVYVGTPRTIMASISYNF